MYSGDLSGSWKANGSFSSCLDFASHSGNHCLYKEQGIRKTGAPLCTVSVDRVSGYVGDRTDRVYVKGKEERRDGL